MNYPISVALLLLRSLPVLPPTPLPLSKLPSETIRLNNPDAPTQTAASALFRHFEVVDERPDTTRIGIHFSSAVIASQRNRQLVFRQPAAREIPDYLDRYFTRPEAPYTALIVLRNLWLSDAKYLREEMVKDPDKVYEKTHIRVRMEIYATRDSLFLPLYRLDTLLVSKRVSSYDLSTSFSNWDKNLAALLNDMADSSALLTRRKEGQAHRVSREEIRRFNQSRFTNPVDGDLPLNAGVYTSFEEFRNNTPSIHDFEVKLEKKAKLLYIKEGGVTYYSHDAWGYCDGKDVYIMRNGFLCPAWREEKAWHFYGEADLEIPSDNNGPYPPKAQSGFGTAPSAATPAGDLVGIQRIEAKKNRIYTIDMDTGAVY